MKKEVSRFPIPKVEELPEEVRNIVEGAQKEMGFVPNVLKALSYRPKELMAFLGYNNAFEIREGGLTAAEREMMIVAFSSYNGCSYCVMSHGAALRQITGNPLISDQIAVNYLEADITPREKAIIDFSMKVTVNSKAINEDDFEVLRGYGLTDDDIWDINAITAFYNMSNRLMNFAAVRPDDVYYMMGRK